MAYIGPMLVAPTLAGTWSLRRLRVSWQNQASHGSPLEHPSDGSGMFSQPPARNRGVASLVPDRAQLRVPDTFDSPSGTVICEGSAAFDRFSAPPHGCDRSRAKAEGRILGPSECLRVRWNRLEICGQGVAAERSPRSCHAPLGPCIVVGFAAFPVGFAALLCRTRPPRGTSRRSLKNSAHSSTRKTSEASPRVPSAGRRPPHADYTLTELEVRGDSHFSRFWLTMLHRTLHTAPPAVELPAPTATPEEMLHMSRALSRGSAVRDDSRHLAPSPRTIMPPMSVRSPPL